MGIIKDLRNRLRVKRETGDAPGSAPVPAQKSEPVKVEKNEKLVAAKKTVKKADKKTETVVKRAPSKYPGLSHILIRPILTEKAVSAGKKNQYTFEVPLSANKVEIKKAVEEMYQVKPLKVRTLNVSGKWVRFGSHFGKRKGSKKAIVTLAPKDKIEPFAG